MFYQLTATAHGQVLQDPDGRGTKSLDSLMSSSPSPSTPSEVFFCNGTYHCDLTYQFRSTCQVFFCTAFEQGCYPETCRYEFRSDVKDCRIVVCSDKPTTTTTTTPSTTTVPPAVEKLEVVEVLGIILACLFILLTFIWAYRTRRNRLDYTPIIVPAASVDSLEMSVLSRVIEEEEPQEPVAPLAAPPQLAQDGAAAFVEIPLNNPREDRGLTVFDTRAGKSTVPDDEYRQPLVSNSLPLKVEYSKRTGRPKGFKNFMSALGNLNKKRRIPIMKGDQMVGEGPCLPALSSEDSMSDSQQPARTRSWSPTYSETTDSDGSLPARSAPSFKFNFKKTSKK